MYKNIVGLLIFVTVASCAGLYSQNSNVVQLTKQNFAEQVFGSSQIWLVEFYAPWCMLKFSIPFVSNYKTLKLLKKRWSL